MMQLSCMRKPISTVERHVLATDELSAEYFQGLYIKKKLKLLSTSHIEDRGTNYLINIDCSGTYKEE